MLLLWFVLGMPHQAAEAPVREHDLKAAYLINFIRFTSWPESGNVQSQEPLVVGILGEDLFGEALPVLLERQRSHGRELMVRRVSEADDLGSLQVLFISKSVGPRYAQVLTRLRNTPVLTVGENEGFARHGGMIGLALSDGTIQFDVNAEAVRQAGLQLSSKVLAVARQVLRSP